MNGAEVIIGVTGGIAAYKTAAMTSQLVQAGAGATVVMTAAALEFVGKETFAALTGRPVATSVFDSSASPLGSHIALAERADLLCVAPATANFLAKTAVGVADDLLSTLYLAFDGPVLMAPAMSSVMWGKPSVQRNVQRLEEDGVQFIGPEEGWLSCRKRGVGRMADPEKILEAIRRQLAQRAPTDRNS